MSMRLRMSPGPIPNPEVMVPSGTSEIQSSVTRATFRSLPKSSYM